MKPHLILLSLAFVCSSPALAQWQWLDKDGRKVFSDRAPPPDVPEKSILKRQSAAARAAPAPEPEGENAGVASATVSAAAGLPPGSGVDKDMEAKKRQAAQAEAAKRQADSDRLLKARIENCAHAKQARTNFETGARLTRTNAAGEREVMDDNARAAEVKRIQAIMDSDCR